MEKLNLPKTGERDWFSKLTQALSDVDGRFVNDGFNRDFVLSNGLSLPTNGGDGDFGINYFRIGDLSILFGWGNIHFEAKAYQSGKITLPNVGANFRAIVSEEYTWDGGGIRLMSTDGAILVTPQYDINSTFQLSMIMIWSQV